MKPCSYRSDSNAFGKFNCSNTADLIHDGTVSACVCERCPYAKVIPAGDFFGQTAQVLVQKQRRGEYRPKPKPCGGCKDATVSTVAPIVPTFTSEVPWVVTVTTAPRAINYLPACLQSLAVAGWTDPVVFAEPESKVPAGVTTVQNETRRGCFHNWVHSARWALENTTADQILMVQDDVVVHPDSRKVFESHCMWPKDAAFVSLYTPSHYSKKKAGILKVTTRNLWGTCAVVWRREILEAVIGSQLIQTWQGLPPARKKGERSDHHRQRRIEFTNERKKNPHKINNSDYAAGLAVVRLRKRMYFLSPSPARHIATVSSIGHAGNTGKRNCGPCADHATPLEHQVFGKAVTAPEIAKILGCSQSAVKKKGNKVWQLLQAEIEENKKPLKRRHTMDSTDDIDDE